MKNKIYWISTFSKQKNSGHWYKQTKEYLKNYEIKEININFELKNLFKNIKLLIKLIRTIKKEDIIHSQYGSTCGLISSLFKQKKIITLRGSDLLRDKNKNYFKDIIRNKLTKLYLKKFNKIIVMSNEMRNEILDHNYNLKKKIIILPDPVDEKNFFRINQNYAKKKLNLRSEFKYILFAAFQIHSENKNYHFIKKVEKKFHQKKVKFIYLKNNIKNNKMYLYLNASNCLLLSSNYEGWPNIIKESFFCDTPVVSTNVSDLMRISKKCIYIQISKLNVEEFVNKINFLIKLKRPKNLKKNLKNFDMKSHINKINILYKSLMIKKNN